MTAGLTHAPEFEAEFAEGLRSLFEDQIVFNHLLGLKVTALHADWVGARLPMRPELIGHFVHQQAHGGVISAALDALGGLAVMAGIGARHLSETPELRLRRFAKLGTIDLRIDYLRPAISEQFTLKAELVRLGSRVANTRMEFFGADGKLLAMGTGAYIVS